MIKSIVLRINITVITHTSSFQNNEYYKEAEIKALIKKTRFKLSLTLDEEGGIKKAKILAVERSIK